MKELHVATDICDEFRVHKRFYDAQHLHTLMKHCRSLGATTIEWILDDKWAIYESYPGGMDLLRTAIEAAHDQGLKFHAVYKPFEGKTDIDHLLPHTAPRPDGVVLWEDLRGLVSIVRPFVVQHPEMCLQRRPGEEDPGGAITSIRLIKNEDTPGGLSASDLSIWTSDVNGRFSRYEGSFNLHETSEWRPVFELGKTCRVVTLSGLNIPAGQRYIEVRLAEDALTEQEFCNEYDQIIELVAADGSVIPSTLAAAKPPRLDWLYALAEPLMSQLVRYAHHPQVRAFLNDKAMLDEQAKEMRYYGQAPTNREYSLRDRRRLAVARGHLRYMCGVLNPVYPEVREHWLEAVRFCIERGADAVNIRSSHHGRIQNSRAYGFNEPVLEKLGGSLNVAEAQRLMGDGYTQFLREARDLLHSHDRQIGVHLLPTLLRPDDDRSGDVHDHMEYQWETWVREIADFAVFRGAMGQREEFLHYVVDRFGAACRRAQIPLVYQCNRRSFDNRPEPLRLQPDRLRWLEREMMYALNHPDVSACQIYETAYFTDLDENGQLQCSAEIMELARKFGENNASA